MNLKEFNKFQRIQGGKGTWKVLEGRKRRGNYIILI